MSSQRPRRLEVENIGDTTVVNFLDKKVLDEQNIQIIGEQLFSLVDNEGCRKVLLNFSNVEYLSSAALGKLTSIENPSAEFEIRLPAKETVGRETLKLSMNYYYCQSSGSGVCKIGSVTWTIPIVLSSSSDSASSSIPVVLAVEK